MRSNHVLCLGLGFGVVLAVGAAVGGHLPPGRSARAAAPPAPTLARLPITFEANEGQTDGSVHFLTRGAGYNMWLQPTAMTMALVHSSHPTPADLQAGKGTISSGELIRMQLEGANAHPKMHAEDKLPGVSNYLLGNDRSKWRTNVARYAKVCAEAVYPGVDLVYYGNSQQLEYDFRLKPGADAQQIKLHYDGPKPLKVDAGGNLVLAGQGEASVLQHKPVVYQEKAGKRVEVAGAFVLQDDHTVGFQVGSYDRSRALVIDPVLGWGSYLGGNDDDRAGKLTTDSLGNVYVTGSTLSSNFPLANQPAANSYFVSHLSGTKTDAFITKFNSTGTTLAYSTYFGGSDIDSGFGICLDASGDIVIGGNTRSIDFPRVNPIQPLGANGSVEDGFVSVIAPNGQSVVYSTVIKGTTGQDTVWSVAADSTNNVYACGWTAGGLTLSASAYQSGFGGGGFDGFLYKIAPPSGGGNASIAYATYLGGNRADYMSAVVVDPTVSTGSCWLAGQTGGAFPTTTGVQQTTYGGGPDDATVTRLDTLSSGASSLFYSTYLGGSADDAANGIALAPGGVVWVTGYAGAGFPTASAVRSSPSGQDAFLTELSSSGVIVVSTFVGGTGTDTGWGVAVDTAGNVTVAGWTTGGLTMLNAAQSTYGGGANDCFISNFTPGAAALASQTYYGGNGDDQVRGLALSPTGDAIISGLTTSTNGIGTTGTVQPTAPPQAMFPKVVPPYDAFVASVLFDRPPVANPDSYMATEAVTLNVNAAMGVLANDTDPDVGDTVSVGSVTTPPAHGMLTLNSDGSFSYTGNALYSGMDTFQYKAKDNHGALSSAALVTITIAPVNHAPTITTATSITVNEDNSIAFTGGRTVSVADGDSAGGTEKVTVSVPSGKGTLTVTPAGSATAPASGTNSVLITGTITDLNATLATLVFTPTTNVNGTIVLSIHADDQGHSNGPALTADATTNLILNAVNDPPVVTRPASVTTNEDTPITFSGNISVADVDFAEASMGATETITLTVSHGTLVPAASTAMVTGSGTGNVTLVGTLTQVNTALNGLTYTPAANFNDNLGSETLVVVANDNGNTGAGGPMTDTKNVSISITPVNDAPVLTYPGPVTATEDTPYVFSGTLSLADVDAAEFPGTPTLSVTLGVSHGTLTPHPTGASVSGSGTSSVVLTGTIAQINTGLNGLTYTPAANFNDNLGTETLTLLASDLGNTGTGGTKTDSESVVIHITAINDAEVITAPATLTLTAGQTFHFTGGNAVSVSDVDFNEHAAGGASGLERVQLISFVPFGTYDFTLMGSTVKTADFVNPQSYRFVQFQGSLTDLNATLATLTFTPSRFYSGPTQFGFLATDDGNTGITPDLVVDGVHHPQTGNVVTFQTNITIVQPPLANPKRKPRHASIGGQERGGVHAPGDVLGATGLLGKNESTLPALGPQGSIQEALRKVLRAGRVAGNTGSLPAPGALKRNRFSVGPA